MGGGVRRAKSGVSEIDTGYAVGLLQSISAALSLVPVCETIAA